MVRTEGRQRSDLFYCNPPLRPELRRELSAFFYFYTLLLLHERVIVPSTNRARQKQSLHADGIGLDVWTAETIHENRQVEIIHVDVFVDTADRALRSRLRLPPPTHASLQIAEVRHVHVPVVVEIHLEIGTAISEDIEFRRCVGACVVAVGNDVRVAVGIHRPASARTLQNFQRIDRAFIALIDRAVSIAVGLERVRRPVAVTVAVMLDRAHVHDGRCAEACIGQR